MPDTNYIHSPDGDFIDVNCYLGCFNRDVRIDCGDKRSDEEIANDYGVEYRGKLEYLYSESAAFLEISPWPWEEVRPYAGWGNEKLSEPEVRQWFIKMLAITKHANENADTKFSPIGPRRVDPEVMARHMEFIWRTAMEIEAEDAARENAANEDNGTNGTT